MARTWLVAHDFSPCAEAALDTAATDLSDFGGGKLVLTHAFAVPYVPVAVPGMSSDATLPSSFELGSLVERQLGDGLAKIEARVKERWPKLDVEVRLTRGAPFEAILQAAEDVKADRIVVGSHGRTGFSHVLLGSVAARVARMSKVPVLVVKAKHEDEEAA